MPAWLAQSAKTFRCPSPPKQPSDSGVVSSCRGDGGWGPSKSGAKGAAELSQAFGEGENAADNVLGEERRAEQGKLGCRGTGYS